MRPVSVKAPACSRAAVAVNPCKRCRFENLGHQVHPTAAALAKLRAKRMRRGPRGLALAKHGLGRGNGPPLQRAAADGSGIA